MKETLQQRLTDDLHRVSSATSVPHPPLAELVQAGKRRVRRNRALSVAAGVAAVCVVMTGVTFGPKILSADDPAQPVHPGPSKVHHVPGTKVRTLDDLPQGGAPRVPYWHDGVLHVDGAEIRTRLRDVVTGGGTTLVGRERFDEVSAWSLVEGDRLVPLVRARHVMPPLVSTDGRLVVWERIEPTATTVTAWDVTTHRVLATRHVEIQQGCCDGPSLTLYGADGSGQVFLGGGVVAYRGLVVWDPASGTAHNVTGLTGLAGAPSKVEASGPVFQSTGTWTSGEGVFGTVDDAGVFHRAGKVPTDQAGTWSPDGTLFAYAGDDTGTYVAKVTPVTQVVLDVVTGRTRTMHLPPGVTGDVTWESPDTLLVHTLTDSSHHYLIRCEADTGACEMALRVGSLRGWSFPESF